MTQLDAFIAKYTGKIVADPKGYFKGECVSLVKRWLEWMKWPMKTGNAIMWQYNGDGKNYKFIKNYVWTIPKAGDIAVFEVGKYGHVGIVVSANIKTMRVFNQNWPSGRDTDPAKITIFNYRKPKCIGFLRKI